MRLRLLVAFMVFTTLVLAEEQDEAMRLLESGNIVPLEKIVNDAKKQHGGHVLEVELESKKGKYYYDLEMLGRDGVVWEFTYDATTGKLLRAKKGD